MKMGKNENADIIQFIKKQIINNNYKSQQNPIFFEDKNINKEINEEKIKQLRNHYNMFILFIYKKLYKKEYKTAINQIEGNFQIYKNLSEVEEILFLKIECLIKIILQKIKKYNSVKKKTRSQNDSYILKYSSFSKNSLKLLRGFYKRTSIFKTNPKKNQLLNINIIISIEKYYSKVYKEIKYLIDNVNTFFQNSQVIYIEKIIQLFLRLLLVKSIHHEAIFQLPYSNYCLSLGKNLFYNFRNFIKDIKTLELFQNIFLQISKNYFENKEYEKTEINCIKVYNLCIRELIFKYGDVNLIPKKLRAKEKKVFLNLSISFLYIGFCKEEKGKIHKALKYYKLSFHITNNFLKNEYEQFANFLSSLIIRANYYKNILFQLQNNKKEMKKEKNEENKIFVTNKKPNKFHYTNIMNLGSIQFYNKNRKLQKNKKEKILQKNNSFIINTIKVNDLIYEDIKLHNVKKGKIENNEMECNAIYDQHLIDRIKKNKKTKIKHEILKSTSNINNSFLKSNYYILNLDSNRNKSNQISKMNLSNIQSVKNQNIRSEKKNSKIKRIINSISKNNCEFKKCSSCPDLVAIDESYKYTKINFTIKQLFQKNLNIYNGFSKGKLISLDNKDNTNQNQIKTQKKVNVKKIFLNHSQKDLKNEKKNSFKTIKKEQSDRLKNVSMNSYITSPLLSERYSNLNNFISSQNNDKKKKTIFLSSLSNTLNIKN